MPEAPELLMQCELPEHNGGLHWVQNVEREKQGRLGIHMDGCMALGVTGIETGGGGLLQSISNG